MENNPFTLINDRLQRIEDHLGKLSSKSPNQPISPKKFLTADEVAELLSLSKGTIYNLVYRSRIPYSKTGKRLYFEMNEIESWVREGNVNVKGE